MLSILPKKSFHLLPPFYLDMLEQMKQFFPDDFDIDFNGKDLPWEAICLIPFVDERTALAIEERVRLANQMEEKDIKRNRYTFSYNVFKHSTQLDKGVIKSTLTNFLDLKHNHSKEEICSEYEDVGSHTFTSFISNLY